MTVETATSMRNKTYVMASCTCLLYEYVPLSDSDNRLFPAANHHLADKDQQRLLAEFDKVKANEIGQGVHNRFLGLANDLAHRLHVPLTEVDHPSHGAAHCRH